MNVDMSSSLFNAQEEEEEKDSNIRNISDTDDDDDEDEEDDEIVAYNNNNNNNDDDNILLKEDDDQIGTTIIGGVITSVLKATSSSAHNLLKGRSSSLSSMKMNNSSNQSEFTSGQTTAQQQQQELIDEIKSASTESQEQQQQQPSQIHQYSTIAVEIVLNKYGDKCLLTNLPVDFTFSQVLYELVDSRSLFHLMTPIDNYSLMLALVDSLSMIVDANAGNSGKSKKKLSRKKSKKRSDSNDGEVDINSATDSNNNNNNNNMGGDKEVMNRDDMFKRHHKHRKQYMQLQQQIQKQLLSMGNGSSSGNNGSSDGSSRSSSSSSIMKSFRRRKSSQNGGSSKDKGSSTNNRNSAGDDIVMVPVNMSDSLESVIQTVVDSYPSSTDQHYHHPPILQLHVFPEIDHFQFVKLFGVPCEFTCMNPMHRCFDERGIAIPRIIKMCMDFLNERGMHEVGVFRVNGAAKNLAALKEQWDRAEYAPFTDMTHVSDVAGILKQYLRSLPNPLMEHALYNRVRQVFIGNTVASDEEKAQKVKKIIDSLPNGHYACLERLMALCNKIQKNEAVIKMNATNLAICLTPSILAPDEGDVDKTDIMSNIQESSQISYAVSFMIMNYSNIFTRNSPYDPELKGLEDSGKGWKRRAGKFDAVNSGTLVVEVISCSDLPAADRSGTSDPFVVIELGQQIVSTKTVTKSCNPVYMEQFELSVYDAQEEQLKIYVYDHDKFTKNDLLCTATIAVKSAEVKRFEHRMTVNMEPQGRIELALIPLNYGKNTNSAPKRKLRIHSRSSTGGDQ